VVVGPSPEDAPAGGGTATPVVGKLDDAGGKKHCRECYALMPVQANRCIACGSAQNWQRYVAQSGSVLALLVALVSVLTFAVPIWRHEFYRPSPRPSIAYMPFPVSKHGMRLAISNGGDAPLLVDMLTFRVLLKNGRWYSLSLKNSLTDSTDIVKQNEITNAYETLSISTDPALSSEERGAFQEIENIVDMEIVDRLIDKRKPFSHRCDISLYYSAPSGRGSVSSHPLKTTDCASAIIALKMAQADDVPEPAATGASQTVGR
jgi:hypothetical protein